jgi:ABC-type antimicrobial peptide transport system permease subunit
VAAVQFQGVLERLGSLGILSAVGFTAGRLRLLVVIETLLMVALGLMAGTLAGCLALVPAFLAGRAAVPAWWIAGTWGATLAAATIAGLAAARRVGRIEPRTALAAVD